MAPAQGWRDARLRARRGRAARTARFGRRVPGPTDWLRRGRSLAGAQISGASRRAGLWLQWMAGQVVRPAPDLLRRDRPGAVPDRLSRGCPAAAGRRDTE